MAFVLAIGGCIVHNRCKEKVFSCYYTEHCKEADVLVLQRRALGLELSRPFRNDSLEFKLKKDNYQGKILKQINGE